MDEFLRLAGQLVIYNLRTSWFQISKMYNEMAEEHDGTVSLAFALLAIDEEDGTQVTKIAPRLGMEPNSLSRILKSMEEKGLIYKKKADTDKRMAFVCLTDKGKEKREIAMKAVYRLERAIIKDLDAEKLKHFFDVVSTIPRAIEEFKTKMALYETP